MGQGQSDIKQVKAVGRHQPNCRCGRVGCTFQTDIEEAVRSFEERFAVDSGCRDWRHLHTLLLSDVAQQRVPQASQVKFDQLLKEATDRVAVCDFIQFGPPSRQ